MEVNRGEGALGWLEQPALPRSDTLPELRVPDQQFPRPLPGLWSVCAQDWSRPSEDCGPGLLRTVVLAF